MKALKEWTLFTHQKGLVGKIGCCNQYQGGTINFNQSSKQRPDNYLKDEEPYRATC